MNIMGLIIAIVLFIIGIVFIVKGGDFFVDAATWIAEVSGIPKFLIGATIVSLATTLPELFVSLIASAKGSVDMAIGNAVGSVTANVGLIMGISVVAIPAIIKRKEMLFKSLMMLLSILLLWLFSRGGSFGIFPSIIMLVIFLIFIIENIVTAKKSMGSEKDEKEPQTQKDVITNIIKFIVGAAGIVAGAQLLVDNGQVLAKAIGIPEAIIGVTVIAIGTSLPELVTTITAISKKQASLSIGNIIGANIIDLTLIMPLCALVSGSALPVSSQSSLLDMPACLLVIALSIIPTLLASKFRRWQGITMLIFYAIYLVLLVVFFI